MTRFYKKTIIFISLLASIFLIANFVSAQGVGQLGVEYGTATGLGAEDIRLTAAKLIRVGLGLLGTVLLVLIIYGGITYMTAAGDSEKVDRAKKIITNSIIGLAIILSSLAIVQFVISRLVAATTGGFDSGAPGTGGVVPGSGLPADSFYVTGITPQGEILIRNVMVRISFSGKVKQSTVNAQTVIIKQAGGAIVPGTYSFDSTGKVVEFKPTTTCGGDAPDQRCFAANNNFTVSLNSGVQRLDSKPLTCFGITAPCTAAFRTGTEIDLVPPVVAITSPPQASSYCVGDEVPVIAQTTDNSGIAYVEYLGEGTFLPDEIDTPLGPSPKSFTSTRNWDSTGLTPKKYAISVRSYDVADPFTTSLPLNLTLRPGTCCNGEQDGDETGVDSGGSCGGGSGAACTDNSSCAVGLSCVNGTCQSKPVITSIDPLDGKAGSYVTIFGYGFGATAGNGVVKFLGNPNDASDDKEAALAVCSNAWTSTAIVVVVPEGALSGPIEVKNNNGLADDSLDLGALGIFQINNVVRPGICQVQPTSGASGSKFEASGVNFGAVQGNSTLTLGDRTAFVSIWSGTLLRDVVVPNIQEGKYVVQAIVNGIESNGVYFNVTIPKGQEPTISGIDPGSGGIGTYVTISGNNFGTTPGSVLFIKGQDIADGDVSFPEMCLAGFWTNTTITVKVPPTYRDKSGILTQAHQIRVLRTDGARSNTATFTVNNTPAGGSLCRLIPDNGPVGTQVAAYGEKFGSEAGQVRFHENLNVNSLSWADGQVSAQVPAGAKTGPVRVVRTGGALSNSRNFQVADCREAGCSVGEFCCGVSCLLDGEPCLLAAHAGSFLWRVATGPIPRVPRVVEQISCGSFTQSPSPYPNTRDACVNAQISVRFSEAMDKNTFLSVGEANDTVKLERCGSGDFNAGSCVELGDLALNFGDWALANGVGGTQLVLTGFQMSTSTWYRVTLDKSLASEGGVNMDASYAWRFRTGSEFCIMDKLEVSPASSILEVIEAKQKYTALPEAANCNVLRCDAFAWEWNSSDISRATVDPPLVCNNSDDIKNNDVQFTEARALAETLGGPPVEITAAVSVLGETKSDFGNLIIDFRDPEVAKYWPNCTAACPNAEVGIVFNTVMDEDTINNNTISLHKCTDESCTTLGPTLNSFIYYASECNEDLCPSYLGEKNVAVLSPEAALDVNSHYVILVHGGSGGVLSTSGAQLTGLNVSNLFWRGRFKTKLDPNLCGVDQVEVSPSKAEVKIMGTHVPFRATPRGSPDECSAAGQPLKSVSYDWNWQSEKPDVGQFYPLSQSLLVSTPAYPSELTGLERERLLNILPLKSGGQCSNMCLNLGSRGNVVECGNALVEFGEDCDDGNNTSGDGCSATCLNEGVQNNGDGWSLTGVGGFCGNGIREWLPAANNPNKGIGEECDDGNKTVGDGCSALCLHEGALAGNSKCGSGEVGNGEDCDDANTTSGDGCSANCLNEGSQPASKIFVCGNNQIEPGEDCDDGNARDGLDASGNGQLEINERDGCSAQCLHQSLSSSWSLLGGLSGICGNGALERNATTLAGEECDDGNALSGDGCSSACLHEGSSLPYALCGDRHLGETQEIGEDCDPGIDAELDRGIDPRQLATAIKGSAISPANVTKIFATTEGKTGQGELQVSCNCRADSDCGNTIANACGAGACCFPRPTVIKNSPPINKTNVCRNTLVSVTFDQKMNKASFLGNFILWRKMQAGDTCEGTKFFGYMPVGGFGDYCPVRASIEVVDVEEFMPATGATSTVSRAELRLEEALVPNHVHVAYVQGDNNVNDSTAQGVRALSGAALKGFYAWKFTSGANICEIAQVRLTPEKYLFNTNRDGALGDDTGGNSAFDKRFLVDAYAASSEAITPIANVYAWEWSWTLPAQGKDFVHFPGNSGTTALQSTNTGTTKNQIIQAGTFNGQNKLIAAATLTAPQGGGSFSDESELTTFLCQNPWPSGSTFPYTDLGTGLTLYYCRDAGEAATLDDDLPAFKPPVAITPPLAYDPSAYWSDPYMVLAAAADPEAKLLKEFLFALNCDDTDAPCKADDALGIRVFSNLEHEGPLDWFKSQGFIGSPSALTIDGYEAVREGRSTYVNAAHLPNWPGGSQAFTNIYVISHNQGAAPEIQNIYNQILGNIIFTKQLGTDSGICGTGKVCSNDASISCATDAQCASGNTCIAKSCSSDLDCVFMPNAIDRYCKANKGKTVRNTKRLSDAVKIYRALSSYKSSKNEYPGVLSGSYLAGQTHSAWPSWQAVLGNALGLAMPRDPLNKFAGSVSSTPYGCPDPYNNETCWDNTALRFFCPAGSFLYSYERRGPQSYNLSIPLENLRNNFGQSISLIQWSLYSCSNDASRRCITNADCGEGNSCVWRGETGDAGAPADNIEPLGDLDPSVPQNNLRTLTQFCTGQVVGSSTTCGDGVVGGNEACEIGQKQVTSCVSNNRFGKVVSACNSTCSGFTAGTCETGSCGDSVVQFPEKCDDGDQNGQYAKCPIDCGVTSGKDIGPYCGDVVKNGSEFCDFGEANGGYGNGCSWDCKSLGPRCGDNEVNGSEQCDGEIESAKGYCSISLSGCSTNANCSSGQTCINVCPNVSSGPDTGREQTRTRLCKSPGQAGQCTWNTWSACQPIGSCGDGQVQTGEDCDDGNTDNTDACISCRNARCGDNFVQAGVEQCDSGSANGIICTAGYNSSCSYCSPSCTSVSLTGPYCGDGLRYAPAEICDGTSFASSVSSCKDIVGYVGGTLSCSPSCSSVTGCLTCANFAPQNIPDAENGAILSRTVIRVCGTADNNNFTNKLCNSDINIYGCPSGQICKKMNVSGLLVDLYYGGTKIGSATSTSGGTTIKKSISELPVINTSDTNKQKCARQGGLWFSTESNKCQLPYNLVFKEPKLFTNSQCTQYRLKTFVSNSQLSADFNGKFLTTNNQTPFSAGACGAATTASIDYTTGYSINNCPAPDDLSFATDNIQSINSIDNTTLLAPDMVIKPVWAE